MSRLTRVLVLGAMLAVMTLTALTAVAQAQPTARDDQRASQDQPTSDSLKRAAEAQERYYSTWSYGDTPAPVRPAEPSGQRGWLVPAIGVLAAVLALVAGLVVMAARRAGRRVRAGQAT